MLSQLRSIRKAKKMTQRALGSLAGLQQERISDLERGKRPPTVVERVALSAVLGIPIQELFPAETLPEPVQRIPFSK